MSSEMRLKKLRGSGGYIMATINDDQQRKGNLGGPDLFLAPVGRIESEKISKFYCNTCEKDYEGAPKIDFENPNEEVAENLILVEKGQYICTTCGATLAEYREFKKPNEMAEVGSVSPSTTPSNTMQEQYSPPPGPLTVPDFATPSETASIQDESISSSQQTESTFNSIVGMPVYDENAKKIGTVKQVGVDPNQTVVLAVTKNDGSELSIKWNQIKKIGEIILLGESQAGSTEVMQQPGKCSNCGYENKAGSKFCESCGTKL